MKKLLCGLILCGTTLLAQFPVKPVDGTGTSITFSYSEDNSTWLDLTDEYGAAVTLTVAANKAVQISNPAGLLGLKYIKLVVSEQAAARTLTLICKPI